MDARLMFSWRTHLRIAGLVASLNAVPFVRGCDGVEGLHETLGFPTPYFHFSMTVFDPSQIRIDRLGLDAALLYATILLFLFGDRVLARTICHRWFSLAVLACAVLLKFANFGVFFVCLAVYLAMEMIGFEIGENATMDVPSRLLFVPLLAICFLIARSRVAPGADCASR